MRTRPFLAATCLGLALALAPGGTRAAPPMPAPACRVTNVTPLNFGGYRAGQSAPLDSVGEIALSCSATVAVQIAIGRSASGRMAPRAMSGAYGALGYELYLDAAHTAIWGDGTQGTQVFRGMVGAGQTLRLPMYGRVFGLQAIPGGVYSDRLVLIVTY